MIIGRNGWRLLGKYVWDKEEISSRTYLTISLNNNNFPQNCSIRFCIIDATRSEKLDDQFKRPAIRHPRERIGSCLSALKREKKRKRMEGEEDSAGWRGGISRHLMLCSLNHKGERWTRGGERIDVSPDDGFAPSEIKSEHSLFRFYGPAALLQRRETLWRYWEKPFTESKGSSK